MANMRKMGEMGKGKVAEKSQMVNPRESDAVLLVAFGGPTAMEEVRPFLAHVLRGVRVPPERVEEVVRHYAAIGGASPLRAITEAQARALECRIGRPVLVGMRHWSPWITEALEEARDRGIRRVITIILAAHRSQASVDQYVQAVEAARAALGSSAPQVEYVRSWFDHPQFITAVVSRVEEIVGSWSSQRRAQAAWLFTAHSLPVAMAQASTYDRDLQASIHGVAVTLGLKRWRLAYQSRSGNPQEPWLRPDILESLSEVAAEGSREVVVIPIGFVADHVEVLYDLDIEAKQAAQAHGLTFWRVATVGTHPAFIDMLAQLVRER